MADNTNPIAVSFANNKARVLAESLLSTIESARVFLAFYNAQTLDNIFPADANNIADGSDVDGRPRISNNAMRALKTAAEDIMVYAAFGSPSRETKLRSISDKGASRF